MQRIPIIPLAAALTLALAAPGFGQGTGSTGQAEGKAAAPAQDKAAAPAQEKAPALQTESQGQASLQTQLDANRTDFEGHKKLEAIKVKGAQTSATARSKAETKLDAAAKKADADAGAQGEAKVASRLAAEFGMTAEELTVERQTLGCSWGELMIAHSLRAMSTTEVSVAELFQLRQDGTGWGQIAAGLGLKLGEAVSAVRAEGQVAAGLAKPDGKVAATHQAARAGAATRAGARVGAGTAQVGAGVGVKIKP